MSDGSIVIDTELETDNFDAEIAYVEQQMEEIQYKLKQADMGFEVGDTSKLEAKYQKLNRTLTTLKKKQSEVIKGGQDWKQIKDSIDGVGNNLTKTIKKMGKWALGIWAVESAYSGIRKIISNISSTDEQIASNIDYMVFTISNVLKPVVNWIINGVYTLLVYLNQILNTWFNINMFANSVDNYLASTNKNAKELKKSMAGFDTANTLSSNADTESPVVPNLSSPEDVPIPTWVQWIMDHGAELVGIIGGIIVALQLLKLQAIDPIISLGIGALIVSIVLLIKDVIDYIKEPSWENFYNIMTDIWIVIGAVMLITGNWLGLLIIIVATIVKLVIDNWNEIKGIFQKAWDWIDSKLKWLEKNFGLLGQAMTEPIRNAIRTIKNLIEGLSTSFKQILDGIIMICQGDFKNGFINVFKGIANIVITIINFLINGLNGIISPIRLLIVAVGKVMGKGWTMDNIKIPTIKYLKNGGIVDVPRVGVPVASNVLAGEAGPEAVIPLNDETMQRLAKYIARFLNIDINITNKLDSRVLLRILKQIKGEQEFARNGG